MELHLILKIVQLIKNFTLLNSTSRMNRIFFFFWERDSASTTYYGDKNGEPETWEKSFVPLKSPLRNSNLAVTYCCFKEVLLELLLCWHLWQWRTVPEDEIVFCSALQTELCMLREHVDKEQGADTDIWALENFLSSLLNHYNCIILSPMLEELQKR